MAKKPFISVDGITVGEASALVNVIASNGDITTSNITVSNSANLGAVGNITITGGSNGYVLSTNGSGTLSWVAQGGGSGNSNIVLDSFTGNGVQTVFTLTTTPTSEDYTLINVDGVSQLHTAYTVSGANVTLSSAPANGAAIEVMTFNLSGAGGGGSSSSNIANGTSNVNIATSGGNVTTSVAGNANVVIVTGTGMNVAGTIAGTQLTSNIATGTAPLSVNSTTIVPNLTSAYANIATSANVTFVSSNISYPTFAYAGLTGAYTLESNTAFSANLANGAMIATTFVGALSGAATTAGTVTTAAQPNITSTGTLTSLTVSGNITGGNLIGTLANGNSNVNIPSANGNVNISAVGNTTMVITGTGANIAGTLNVTGNITPGGSIVTRVVSIADGTTVTMNADTTDMATQNNTQATGTLTIAAPTGTPTNGQKLMFRLLSTNVQTFSWNAVFQGSSDLALPTASSGSSKYDYTGFIWNSTNSKWQLLAKNFGY